MRPSVVFEYHDKKVLVDATPELRLQCLAQNVDWIDSVVITHAHADHIMGLDDVRRFNAIRNGPLDVWADEHTHKKLMACFGYAFREPDPEAKVFRPHLIPRTIEGAFDIEGARWQPIPLLHGKMPVLGFRVGRIAYCTDVSEVPESSMEYLQNLDVLVIDALAWRAHPTHFSIEQAMRIVDRVKPNRTYFTHIAHGLAHQETNEKLVSGVELAYDGLLIESEL